MKSTNLLIDITSIAIVSLIWQQKAISRIDIANILNIDKSTVTKNVAKLKEFGLIHEFAEGKSGPQGGRKPILLEINAKFGCIGGVEINSERFICILLDLQGNILFQMQKNISPEVFSFLGCKGIFDHAYEVLLAESLNLHIPLIAIGVGMPGIIDNNRGLILQSTSILVHESYNFVKDVQADIPVSIILNNDARCCCAAEKLIRRENPVENALFLLLEYRLTEPHLNAKKNLSVGMGFILNNKTFSGKDYLAGEFRSILWQKGLDGQFSGRVDIHDNAKESTISFETACVELSKHIAFLVNMLNLETIYVGGSKFESMQYLQEEILNQIDHLFPYDIPSHCLVRASSVGNLSVSYGAAAMCLESLFTSNEEGIDLANICEQFIKKV